jgi:branched-chain amino acid aminotransferase
MADTATASTTTAPFGSVVAPLLTTCTAVGGVFGAPSVAPLDAVSIGPTAHALHYGSSVFEGLKAHRGVDDVVRLFRLDAHVARLRRSAVQACLPVPDVALVAGMVRDVVAANLDVVPAQPGSLYLRPVLMGTDRNIGAAATPSRDALLFVLASPVGDYFAGGGRPLRIVVETGLPRTTPQFGQVKSGANYVMGLGLIQQAKRDHGADQVLFAPDGDVQETGAANFLLLDDRSVGTKGLDGSFLHGVTRDSILTLARGLGYAVDERDVTVDELLAWADRGGEAALAGTAAVLSAVGTLVHEGREVTVGHGRTGSTTQRLRDALLAIQRAEVPDAHGWTVPVVGD